MLIGFDASRAFVDEATGTENYSLNLLKALAKIDRKNRYVVYLRENTRLSVIPNFRDPELDSRFPACLQAWRGNDRVRVKGFPANFEFKVIRPRRFWTQVGLAWETWRNPVDLLFVPAHTLPILRRCKIEFSILNSQFSILWSPKYVVTIHDLGVEYLPNYHKFPQRYYLDFASKYAARHADSIIAVSAATKSDLVKRYGVDGKKVFVVHEGVDTRFFRPVSEKEIKKLKLKYQINRNYILFVGTVQPRKNLRRLISAFARASAKKNAKDVCLVIVGKLGWDYKEILDLPQKLGIVEKVMFLGRVKNEDLPALYSGAVVFAYPSLFEGFGLPILEALACDCPVIASDIAPHREISHKLLFERVETSREVSTKTDKSLSGKFSTSSNNNSNFVPMILANPKDQDKWVQFLYQSITQYDNRLSFVHPGLSAWRWDSCAKKTLEVFSKVLG